MQKKIDLTVLVPAFNEKDNMMPLARSFSDMLKAQNFSIEVLVIDDGSTDNTSSEVKKLMSKYSFLRLVEHRKNLGKTAAIQTGIRNSNGDSIVIFDADLQFDPYDIPKLYRKLMQGYDIVTGKKIGNYQKPLVSGIYNSFCRMLFKVPVTDMNSIKIFRRYVMQGISMRKDWHRYMIVLAVNRGYSVTEIDVTLRPRFHGVSKYQGPGLMFIGLFDLLAVWFLVTFMKKPMMFFGTMGFISSAAGLILGIGILIARFAYGWGYPPLQTLVVLLVQLGFTSFIFGALAEMVAAVREKVEILNPYATVHIVKESESLEPREISRKQKKAEKRKDADERTEFRNNEKKERIDKKEKKDRKEKKEKRENRESRENRFDKKKDLKTKESATKLKEKKEKIEKKEIVLKKETPSKETSPKSTEKIQSSPPAESLKSVTVIPEPVEAQLEKKTGQSTAFNDDKTRLAKVKTPKKIEEIESPKSTGSFGRHNRKPNKPVSDNSEKKGFKLTLDDEIDFGRALKKKFAVSTEGSEKSKTNYENEEITYGRGKQKPHKVSKETIKKDSSTNDVQGVPISDEVQGVSIPDGVQEIPSPSDTQLVKAVTPEKPAIEGTETKSSKLAAVGNKASFNSNIFLGKKEAKSPEIKKDQDLAIPEKPKKIEKKEKTKSSDFQGKNTNFGRNKRKKLIVETTKEVVDTKENVVETKEDIVEVTTNVVGSPKDNSNISFGRKNRKKR